MSETERVYRSLGQRVAELRRARGWTQEMLADEIGIDARDVRRIEAGDNLTIDTLVKLARAFGIAIGALFEPAAAPRARKPGRPVNHLAAFEEPKLAIRDSTKAKKRGRAAPKKRN